MTAERTLGQSRAVDNPPCQKDLYVGKCISR